MPDPPPPMTPREIKETQRARRRLSPERRGFIEAALEHAKDFSDGAWEGYLLGELGISPEELEAFDDRLPWA